MSETAVKFCAVLVATAAALKTNCVELLICVTVALLLTPRPTMAMPWLKPEVLAQFTVVLPKVVEQLVRFTPVGRSRFPLPSATSGAGFMKATM